MLERDLKLPEQSFFLLGPRGTGKTTWLRAVMPQARWYDLLRTTEYLRLARDPGQLRADVEALPHGSWVVIDEIQRLPVLTNEVHSLMADRGDAFRFALSGSSARKLKRVGANMLAGRAINRRFYPLTGHEVNYQVDPDRLLKYGMLPAVVTQPDAACDFLDAYALNYLEQEIQQEAAARNLESFSRFLRVAALMNGTVVNLSNVARDSAVSRPTVERYVDVLVATLIAFWLPAWRPRAKVKERQHPKLYLFDPGVARSVGGRLREPLDSAERGPLLETAVLHELHAFMNTSGCGGELYYWATPSGQEVDIVWQRGERRVGIEVKSSREWRREYGRALRGLLDDKALAHGFGVYLGDAPQRDGTVSVLPLTTFMRQLTEGGVIGD